MIRKRWFILLIWRFLVFLINFWGVSTGAGWSLTVSIAHVVMNSRCLFDFQTLGESHDFAGHVAADAGQRRHMMHGTWYIYLHWPYESTKHRYIFPYMDPMGSLGKHGVQRLFWKTCMISLYIYIYLFAYMYFYILMISGWRSFKIMMKLVIQVQFYADIFVGSCSRSTLSSIIVVQWKITWKIKGNDPTVLEMFTIFHWTMIMGPWEEGKH